MYTLFGNKWLNLDSGPMWKVESTQQDSVAHVSVPLSRSRLSADVDSSIVRISVNSVSYYYSSQARVNIPALIGKYNSAWNCKM